MLPLLGGKVSDSYSLALQVGFAALNGIVIGVVYNLAIGRPGYRHWRMSAVCAALFSGAVGAVVVAYVTLRLDHAGKAFALDSFNACVFAIGGAALAVAGVGAVRLACEGRPVGLASIAILPNTAFTIFVLPALFLRHSGWGEILPGLGWLAATFVLCAWRLPDVRRESGAEAPHAVDMAGHRLQAGSLLVGALTSSVIPTVILLAMSALPAGQTTAVYLVSRILTSVVGLGVTSVLLVKYNWNTTSTFDVRPIWALVFAAGVAVGGSVAVHRAAPGLRIWSYATLCAALLALLCAAAIMLREVNVRRMARIVATKVGIDGLVATLLTIGLFGRPSITGYFGVYMASQAVTIGVTAAGLKIFRLTGAAAVLAVVVVWIVLAGW